MTRNPVSTTKPNSLPFEARKWWGFSANYPGTERCSGSSPTKIKETWADVLEGATGSPTSPGRREAKRLDEVSETLASHVVGRSWEDLFQPEVTCTELWQSIKKFSSPFSARKTIQRKARNAGLPSISFFYCASKYWSHLTAFNPTGILSVWAETETACLGGVGVADKILACHLWKWWEASHCSDKHYNNVLLNQYDG